MFFIFHIYDRLLNALLGYVESYACGSVESRFLAKCDFTESKQIQYRKGLLVSAKITSFFSNVIDRVLPAALFIAAVGESMRTNLEKQPHTPR